MKKQQKGISKLIKPDQPILVTTQFRGVFFGYFASQKNGTVTLRRARNCISWPVECKGFLGLAQAGPLSGSRVGPPVEELTLYSVTAIARVSPEAQKLWESQPWT